MIGFSAKMKCGKTTLTGLFLSDHPEYTRIGFADILKKECSGIFDYPLEWNYTEEGKMSKIYDHPLLPKPIMLVREILQWYGTDYCRKKDPDYWVKKMQMTVHNICPVESEVGIPKIIIDDVRFKNEATWVHSMGGLMVRLNPYPEWKPGEFADHPSETDLDDYIHFDLILNPAFGELKKCLPFVENLV